MSIFETIRNDLIGGKRGILATVMVRTGSAPRDVGAKLYVSSDGTSHGTVGGGLLERDVLDEAGKNPDLQNARVLHVRMDSKNVDEQGMICGGNVDILLEPVREEHRQIYDRLVEMEQKGRRAVIATSLDETFTKTLIEDNLLMTGDAIDQSLASEFFGYADRTRSFTIHDGSFFIEPVHTKTKLYVFGAGHVSQYISKIADMVGFSVVVIDDRQEFANRERFPEADTIIARDFIEAFGDLSFSGHEFVVVVTRGHSHDADVLKNALPKKTRYLGMIGSRRKVKMIFDMMRHYGFSEEDLSRVHAPIGLSIHAETPQEIAVSIVGELIQIRGE